MKKVRNEKKKPIQYFAEREEQAVISYINSDCEREKNKIYNDILQEPFRIMTESILRRYPIHIGNYDIEEVEANALTHLIEHMVKYRPFIIERNDGISEKWEKLPNEYRFFYIEHANDKLESLIEEDKTHEYRMFYSRAFSYCQTIIRNHYLDHSKKSYSEKKINLNFEDYIDAINQNIEYRYEMEINEQQLLEKLIDDVVLEIEVKINTDTTIKKNELLVGDAVSNVLKNWQVLFMEDTPEGKYEKRVTNKFAKNKILFFLKEQTGLTTKEIRVGMKPFKEIYLLKKIKYMDDF